MEHICRAHKLYVWHHETVILHLPRWCTGDEHHPDGSTVVRLPSRKIHLSLRLTLLESVLLHVLQSGIVGFAPTAHEVRLRQVVIEAWRGRMRLKHALGEFLGGVRAVLHGVDVAYLVHLRDRSVRDFSIT